jgi:hypothetical protein
LSRGRHRALISARPHNPEGIIEEISSALTEHEGSQGHMRAAGEGQERNWSCSHQPEYVELTAIALQQDAIPEMFLKPAEGFLIADELVEVGWNDYVFPSYYVKSYGSGALSDI